MCAFLVVNCYNGDHITPKQIYGNQFMSPNLSAAFRLQLVIFKQ